MAIAVYSTTAGATNTTVSVDCGSGANRYMVALMNAGTTPNVLPSSVVYAGSVTLTKICDTSSSATGARRGDVIYGGNVSSVSGTNNIVVSGSLSNGIGDWTIIVYSGVDAVTGAHNAVTTPTTGASTTFSQNITAVNGDWIIGIAQDVAGGVNESTNTTRRGNSGATSQADSNGVASPTALNWTGTSGTWDSCGAAISVASAVSANPSFLLNFI